MKIVFFFIVVLLSFSGYAQTEEVQDTLVVMEEPVYEDDSDYDEETYEYDYSDYLYDEDYSIDVDTAVHQKSLDYASKRLLPKDLKDRYKGKDFEYKDEEEKEASQPVQKKNLPDASASAFFSFMKSVFPYLLGILVVFIILKSFLNADSGFWNRSKIGKKTTEKLVHEEVEDIHENDFERLVQVAIRNNDFRSATRYYYLFLLKKLEDKGLISYHKDKTNTEYKFELKSEDMRKGFSQLSYIYDYVWYGEFPVDLIQFNTIEKNYKQFIQTL